MSSVTSLAILAAALAVVAALLGVLILLDRRAMASERQAHRREIVEVREQATAELASLRAELQASRDEAAQVTQGLNVALDEIERMRARAERAPAAVITSLPSTPHTTGVSASANTPPRAEVLGKQLVVSNAVAEPLVKSAALLHGVRRALSPAVRSRIAFEIKHATRLARKQRRQRMRAILRDERKQARS